MSASVKDNSVEEKTLSTWSQLPDIEKVTDRLSVKGEQFLGSVGKILVKYRQTSRFAVTLLHSHFEVYADEALVERLDLGGRYLISEVRSLAKVKDSEEIVPKSWRYSAETTDSDVEQFEILTWSERAAIPQAPLSAEDGSIIRELSAAFREHNVRNIFGMALVGTLPDHDSIWTEGTDIDGRCLVQEQLPRNEVDARNPIKTMWVFGEDGRFLITLACCLRTRDRSGHTTRVHPRGGD